MRTASEVRAHFLTHWRDIVPEILVTGVRVGTAPEDPAMVEVELLSPTGAVRRLLCLPAMSGEPRQVRGLLPRLRRLALTPGVSVLLVVPHMGAAGARLAREANIGYLDCCGNAFLRFNAVFVQISGNRNRFSERKQIRTLFHDKATIPLRVLLERPGDWLTTREIAERGSLSLGWVSQILQQMHADGYIERKAGGGSRLVQPKRLVSDWLGEYAFEVNEIFPFQLQEGEPELVLQKLRTVNSDLASRYALTLQSAVHAMRLRRGQRRLPFDLHVYVPDLNGNLEETLERWRQVLGLRPAGHGANCFLVKPAYPNAIFFGAQASHGLRAVSDLQLYLDFFHQPGAERGPAAAAIGNRLPFDVVPELGSSN
ncbi:MAG: hypothetical protein GKS06_16890 [Acidobacteria bacterium]|nr:hypothetical protein [Acidobacteriota bacterium]